MSTTQVVAVTENAAYALFVLSVVVLAAVHEPADRLPPEPCRPARKPDAPKPGRKPGRTGVPQ